jgi:DNA-binding response OmpR family regulator
MKEPPRARSQVIEDGEAALAYLQRDAPYTDAVRPDLILLDLNLPRKSGHELLKEIKAHHELKRIPVIILTTSTSDLDVSTSYALGANSYVTKPADLDNLYSTVDAINSFWLRTATLSR